MQQQVYHLAQMSISKARCPLDEPLMQGFVSQLKHINSVADSSPGFIWRLQSEAGDATAFRGFDDPLILLNMSLWASFEALHSYVYTSAHKVPFGQRQKWFQKIAGPVTALWWVPAGQTIDVAEGVRRLEIIRARGPSPEAFDLQHPFAPPEHTLQIAAAMTVEESVT